MSQHDHGAEPYSAATAAAAGNTPVAFFSGRTSRRLSGGGRPPCSSRRACLPAFPLPYLDRLPPGARCCSSCRAAADSPGGGAYLGATPPPAPIAVQWMCGLLIRPARQLHLHLHPVLAEGDVLRLLPGSSGMSGAVPACQAASDSGVRCKVGADQGSGALLQGCWRWWRRARP